MNIAKNIKLYNSITNIQDEIIEEAQMIESWNKKTVWMKWSALVACLVLVFAFSVTLVSNLLVSKDTIPPLNIVSFNNAYYELIDCKNTKTLNRYSLPKQIDTSMIGNLLGMAKNEIDGSSVSLYEYIPDNKSDSLGQSVYISRADNSEEYQYALFCNFIDTNADIHPIQDLLNVHAIYDSSDILSVSIYETDDITQAKKNTLKKTITNSSKLKEFYDELFVSDSVGSDGYYDDVYNKYNDELSLIQGYNSTKWVTIKVESVSGAIAYFRYSPDVQYVYWALNYYKVSNTFDTWIQNNS